VADRTTSADTDRERQTEEGQNAQAGFSDGPEPLRNRVTAAEKQRDEYLSQLRRTRAEFENYQKRVHRDLADERRYAHAALARDLLPVLDNLQRALDAARQVGEQGPLAEGVNLVLAQQLDILRRFGVTPIDALGQPFDPQIHEAVLQEPGSDAAPGTVVRVLEPGYRLHERVLRPPKVVVAAPIPA
jgi:molecular chaperone GrpE